MYISTPFSQNERGEWYKFNYLIVAGAKISELFNSYRTKEATGYQRSQPYLNCLIYTQVYVLQLSKVLL